ncbi:hypothetical protein H9X77_15090, partial [Clostridium saudiense]|nr:hypothetical protein [Clostridium saudiense]
IKSKKTGENSIRSTVEITIHEGKNRQIRRMCEALGYEVTKLKRIRIMNVNLDNLKIGQWRDLTEKELKEINELISTSIKTKDIK